MKKTLTVVGLIAIALTLSPPGGQGADAALEKEVAALRQRLVALETRLKALEGAVQVSGGNVKIASAGGLSLQGGATVDIRGAVIKLNGGGRPLARLGDRVTMPATTPGAPALGQISEGSPTVLAP